MIAIIGLGGEAAQHESNPRIAWVRQVERQILVVNLCLVGAREETGYQHLVFISATVAPLGALDAICPGMKDAISIAIHIRPNEDRLPVAIITYADDVVIDLSIVTFSFDINIPFPFLPGTTFADAVLRLHSSIFLERRLQ
jgi:hypothetical protein